MKQAIIIIIIHDICETVYSILTLALHTLQKNRKCASRRQASKVVFHSKRKLIQEDVYFYYIQSNEVQKNIDEM